MARKQSEGEAIFEQHCRIYKLDPVIEHYFCEGRMWRMDFAWPEKKVAVEINGGTWNNGRHNRGSSIEAEYEKLNCAAVLGWRVLQFTTNQVHRGDAIDLVLEVLA